MKTQVTLSQAISLYLAERTEQVTASTLSNETDHLLSLQQAIGPKPLRAKHKMTIVEDLARRCQRWLDELGRTRKASTVLYYASTASRLFNFCLRRGWLIYNPMRFVRRPRRRLRPPPIFTFEEYERIKAETAGTPYHWLTVAGYRTGMSMVDVCLLQWTHVNFDLLYISKQRQKLRHLGVAPTTIPFLPGSDIHLLLQEFRDHPSGMWPGPTYVCPELASIYMGSPHRLRMGYTRLLRKLGLTGRSAMHLRHTFISALANSNTNTALACKMSGHANPQMLARYVKPDVEAMRASILRANEFMEKDHVKLLPPPTMGPDTKL